MLSQRINLELYKKVNGQADMLSELFEEWQLAHQEIIGTQLTKTLQKNDQSNSVEQSLEHKISIVSNYISTNQFTIKQNLPQLTKTLEAFLSDMNKYVKKLETLSVQKLFRLRLIEFFLFTVSVSVIVFELFFVFRPIEQRLLTYITELKNSANRLKIKDEQLEEMTFITSPDLQEPLTNIIFLAND